jgi:hypothetical protein
MLFFKSRAQVLIKSLQDLYNQTESKKVESCTFEKIREREVESIDKRAELLKQDVTGQTEREKQLQYKFRSLCLERDALLAGNQ